MRGGQIEDELSRKHSFMRVKFVERKSLYNFAVRNEMKIRLWISHLQSSD